MINFKQLLVAGALAFSVTSYAANYTIDKTIVESNKGQHFFSLELNNVIDEATANLLKVTDSEDNEIKGKIVLIPNGTALKTSVVQFYPEQQDCFKKIITLQLGDVSTRIVPGTSGISGVAASEMKAAGFAYNAGDAANFSMGYASQGMGVLDVIPRPNTQDASPYTPIMVFFGDIVDTDTVTPDNMTLQEVNGELVTGQIGFSTSTAGNTIVTFTPNRALKPNTEYTFTVNSDLKDSEIWEQFKDIASETETVTDDEGNPIEKLLSPEKQAEKRKELFTQIKGSYIYNSIIWMPVAYNEVTFKTGDSVADFQKLQTNMNFQKNSLEGFSKSGNAQVMSSFGSLQMQSASSSDNYIAAISTHDAKLQGHEAGMTAGTIVTADVKVPADAQWLAFDTNFLTAEFPQFVGSIYDDTYLVSIRTPFGVQTINAASVNSLGLFKVNEHFGAPGLIGSLDKFNILNSAQLPGIGRQALNGETTWHTRAFYVGGLAGQTINLSFHITNVGDGIYQSIAMVDNIRFVKKQPSLKSDNLKDAYKLISSGVSGATEAESIVTISVDGGSARNDQRYVLSQIPGTDSFRLSLFSTADLVTTYFGQKTGDKITVYPEGAVSNHNWKSLEKRPNGYIMTSPDEFTPTFLNQESYIMDPIEKAVAEKRKYLNGDNNPTDPIPLPGPPVIPFNE